MLKKILDNIYIEVIDDYYKNPYNVRDFAISCDFDKPFTGTWNGFHSLQRHPNTQEVFFDISSRIPEDGRPNWKEIEGGYDFWGRPSAGIFALLLKGQKDTVHFHRRTGTWAGVCYLSLPQDCEGRRGLLFFRHKETGFTSWRGANQEQIDTFRRDGNDQNKWEEIGTVDMIFNRMVVFDGRSFHAASEGFGNTASDGRLAQLFNIDFVID